MNIIITWLNQKIPIDTTFTDKINKKIPGLIETQAI